MSGTTIPPKIRSKPYDSIPPSETNLGRGCRPGHRTNPTSPHHSSSAQLDRRGADPWDSNSRDHVESRAIARMAGARRSLPARPRSSPARRARLTRGTVFPKSSRCLSRMEPRGDCDVPVTCGACGGFVDFSKDAFFKLSVVVGLRLCVGVSVWCV